MKLALLALALVAAVAAAPQLRQQQQQPYNTYSKIISSNFNPHSDGGYNYAYQTEDGSNREEIGELKQIPDDKNELRSVVVSRGSYSYYDQDGVQQYISYYADETGFHAEGPSIPKAARK